MPSPRRFVPLTDDEHLVVTARSHARHLGARLVITPVDPTLYQELGAFLAGQGAAALSALSALQSMPAEQLHARLAQVSGADPIAPAARLELVYAAAPSQAPADAWDALFDAADPAPGVDGAGDEDDGEIWPYGEDGA